MTTIVDTFILEFKLDPTGVVTGRRITEDELKKTREGFKKTSDTIDTSVKRTSNFFRELRGQLIGVLAAFTAGKGFKEFTTDLSNADARLKRMSTQFGTTARELAVWGNAAKAVGGSVEGLLGSFQAMSSGIQQYLLSNNSETVAWLYRLGIKFRDSSGNIKNAATIYKEIASAFDALHVSPQKRAEILGMLGADQGTINLMAKGRAGLEEYLAIQEKALQANEKDFNLAVKRQEAWNQLLTKFEDIGRALLTNLQPILEVVLKTLNAIADWAKENPTIIEAAFLAMSAAATALSVALGVGVLGSLLKIAATITPIGRLILLLSTLIGLATNWEDIQNWWTGGGKPKISLQDKKDAERIKSSGIDPKLQPQAQQDIKFLMAKGWTRARATGIVANLVQESRLDPGAEGDGGKAYGLAQWHPDRQRDFAAWAGRSIVGSSREQQLAFLDYELRKGKEKRAGTALMGTTSEADAAYSFSRLYQRPRDPGEAYKRSAMASALAMAMASPNNLLAKPGTVNNTTSTTIIEQMIVNTKATDVTGIAESIKATIDRRSTASQANTGAH